MASKGRNRHLDGPHKIGRGTLETCDMSSFSRQLTTQKSCWARGGHRSKSWYHTSMVFEDFTKRTGENEITEAQGRRLQKDVTRAKSKEPALTLGFDQQQPLMQLAQRLK